MLLAQLIAHFVRGANGVAVGGVERGEDVGLEPAAEVSEGAGDDASDRETVRRDQDAEYQRACDVDEARQRLAGPVDEDAVRSARLRHWLQSP